LDRDRAGRRLDGLRLGLGALLTAVPTVPSVLTRARRARVDNDSPAPAARPRAAGPDRSVWAILSVSHSSHLSVEPHKSGLDADGTAQRPSERPPFGGAL